MSHALSQFVAQTLAPTEFSAKQQQAAARLYNSTTQTVVHHKRPA